MSEDSHVDNTLPLIDPILVRWLQARYPDRCPSIDYSDRKIWMEAGAREVVNTLIELHNSQQKEDDEDI